MTDTASAFYCWCLVGHREGNIANGHGHKIRMKSQLDVVARALQWEGDLREFKASLVYVKCSRPTRGEIKGCQMVVYYRKMLTWGDG